MITLNHLTKKFHAGTGSEIIAVNDVSYEFGDGIFYALVGKSGSGKSTLLNIIGTIDTATSGSMAVDGKDIFTYNADEKALYRRKRVGFVFQAFHLLPMLTVKENIMLPFVMEHRKGCRDACFDKGYFEEMVQMLELDALLGRRPQQLSGGQQQRVAIARAMINKPLYILADEPTGNLDCQTSGQVMQFLTDCVKKFHQTLILVTHDEDVAAMADVLLEVRDGRLYNREKVLGQ